MLIISRTQAHLHVLSVYLWQALIYKHLIRCIALIYITYSLSLYFSLPPLLSLSLSLSSIYLSIYLSIYFTFFPPLECSSLSDLFPPPLSLLFFLSLSLTPSLSLSLYIYIYIYIYIERERERESMCERERKL